MGIAGIGNLGNALLKNRNFTSRGFRFVAAFDTDPNKIGSQLSSGGGSVYLGRNRVTKPIRAFLAFRASGEGEEKTGGESSKRILRL